MAICTCTYSKMCRDNSASLVSCAPWCSQNVPRFSSHMQLLTRTYLSVCFFDRNRAHSLLAPPFGFLAHPAWVLVWSWRINIALVIACVWNRVGEGAAAATKIMHSNHHLYLSMQINAYYTRFLLSCVKHTHICHRPVSQNLVSQNPVSQNLNRIHSIAAYTQANESVECHMTSHEEPFHFPEAQRKDSIASS